MADDLMKFLIVWALMSLSVHACDISETLARTNEELRELNRVYKGVHNISDGKPVEKEN